MKIQKPGPEEKFLLILDNASCHPSAEELNTVEPQFKVVYLPPNVTSILQLMDQGVTEALKRSYRSLFLRNLVLSDATAPDAIKTFLKQ